MQSRLRKPKVVFPFANKCACAVYSLPCAIAMVVNHIMYVFGFLAYLGVSVIGIGIYFPVNLAISQNLLQMVSLLVQSSKQCVEKQVFGSLASAFCTVAGARLHF